MSTTKAPYGTWKSPITAEAINANSINFSDVLVDPLTLVTYHIESRSTGLNALVSTAANHDVVAGEWNVRSGVHEYGGAPAIVYGGIAYFSNFADGRVYSVREGGAPEAVTPENKAHLFADFAVAPAHPSLLVAILEDHTNDTPQTVENTLCVIDTAAKSLAWVQWHHPDMPWEGAELFVADVAHADGTLRALNATHIAGKKRDVSVAYPAWADDSTLVFMNDASGYYNPWKYATATRTAAPVLAAPVAEDFARPPWTLGSPPYALVPGGAAGLFTAFRGGANILYVADIHTPAPPREVAPCPFAVIASVRSVGPEFVFAALRSDGPGGVVRCSFAGAESAAAVYTVLKSASQAGSATANFPREIISPPLPRTFAVPPEDAPLHAVLYKPVNPAYAGSSVPGEKPPCIVNVHGGPTSLATTALSWEQQYYTSRGWAWLDVNYGGSSGYGREYTALLAGKWGVKDVADCLQAAKALAGEIDTARVVLRGGSSGGYAVLSALSFGPEAGTFYAAGASYYGISNLRLLTQFTHKFELMYMIKLMGGTIDAIPDVYDKDRSPIWHADRIVKPLLILQGTEDKVVPPEQSEAIYRSIQARGGKVKYILFPGEGHGFRKAENKIKALEAEIRWYEEVLGLAV
ncbi:alpha/beta-hydrolase [Athelia psychrophila]|uniref:Alpha/beta-hydrolase n=1 Tax=Athelia psychrophila TaxID=1759441 RepID=A0A166PAT1_9AGAM|nr:alpha/beta-hydrolase [Fibularhizoctonia sp. CBS 109695]